MPLRLALPTALVLVASISVVPPLAVSVPWGVLLQPELAPAKVTTPSDDWVMLIAVPALAEEMVPLRE